MTTSHNTVTATLSDLHDHELEQHLTALGLRSVEEYVSGAPGTDSAFVSRNTGTSGARNGTLRCNRISSPDLPGGNTRHAIPERRS